MKTDFNLADTQKLVRRYDIYNRLAWVLNVVLLALSFYQFHLVGYAIVVDRFFVIVNVLNVASFYLTYKIFDRLCLYRHRLDYIQDNQTQS